MGAAEIRAIRIKYRALRLALTQKRNVDRKALELKRKEDKDALEKAHYQAVRTLEQEYMDGEQALYAAMHDEIEGA